MENNSITEEKITFREALTRASDALREAGTESPMLDARILLADAAGVDMMYLITHDEDPLSEETEAAFNKSITERLACRPVAYITGKKEFYGHEFEVREGILIPRPDTETAVEAVIEYADRYAGTVNILDLCCGSGAIGLSVALACPSSYVTLSDISDTAVSVTVRNAAKLGAENCEIIQSDLFEDITPVNYDIIVSNPPYVTGDEMMMLSDDIQLWEPREALYGGWDGLSFYRQIIPEAVSMFRNRGVLILEIGKYQADEVRALLEESEYENITFRQDLAGVDRVVCAEHSPAGKGEIQ